MTPPCSSYDYSQQALNQRNATLNPQVVYAQLRRLQSYFLPSHISDRYGVTWITPDS
jgi:hypothetical protein